MIACFIQLYVCSREDEEDRGVIGGKHSLACFLGIFPLKSFKGWETPWEQG